MPTFLIDAGNSTTGAVGFVYEVEADDKKTALRKAKSELPEMTLVCHDNLRIYINASRLTLDDVMEV